MKSLCFLLAFVLTLQAQGQKNFKLSQNSVVKDMAGNVYPYAVWQTLLRNGDFTIKAENPKDSSTAFLLIPLTENEKQARFERMPKPKESANFTTDKEVNLFNTKDIDGNKIDLKNAKDKIIVINFWFVNCGPCRREIPDLNKLVDSFKTNEKVLFIGVALDAKSDLEKFLKQFPFNYTIVDDGRWIADKYGIRFYPTHVVIDTEGKVYFHTSGLATNTVYWIKKSINELLAKTKKDVATQ
jgi:thiol-disulfide isomerase/thioredoxin